MQCFDNRAACLTKLPLGNDFNINQVFWSIDERDVYQDLCPMGRCRQDPLKSGVVSIVDPSCPVQVGRPSRNHFNVLLQVFLIEVKIHWSQPCCLGHHLEPFGGKAVKGNVQLTMSWCTLRTFHWQRMCTMSAATLLHQFDLCIFPYAEQSSIPNRFILLATALEQYHLLCEFYGVLHPMLWGVYCGFK